MNPFVFVITYIAWVASQVRIIGVFQWWGGISESKVADVALPGLGVNWQQSMDAGYRESVARIAAQVPQWGSNGLAVSDLDARSYLEQESMNLLHVIYTFSRRIVSVQQD